MRNEVMIWDFEKSLMRRLLLWAILSILFGAGLIFFGDHFWQGFGIQALAWGAVDGIIVWFGWRRVRKNLGVDASNQINTREARRIRKILWINTALDVLYMASGAVIIFTLGSTSAFWRGTGWGIIIQAVFLFIFDMWHAFHVPHPSTTSSLIG
jgi:hypothetical protein